MTGELPGRPGVEHETRSFGLPTLVPGLPVFDWLRRLDAEAERSPAWLGAGTVALDLSRAALHAPGIHALVRELQGRGVRVAGLTGVEPARLGEHLSRLPPLLAGGDPARPAAPATAAAPVAPAALLIEENVRSGQQLRCSTGDVTVVGSVSSGAEIVAGGSIHVYGTLRGRAIAGLVGRSARIFCRRLEAELLAIDGVPLAADDMDPRFQGRPVRAWCDGTAVRLESLD